MGTSAFGGTTRRQVFPYITCQLKCKMLPILVTIFLLLHMYELPGTCLDVSNLKPALELTAHQVFLCLGMHFPMLLCPTAPLLRGWKRDERGQEEKEGEREEGMKGRKERGRRIWRGGKREGGGKIEQEREVADRYKFTLVEVFLPSSHKLDYS